MRRLQCERSVFVEDAEGRKAIEPKAGCDLWEATVDVRMHKRRKKTYNGPATFSSISVPRLVMLGCERGRFEAGSTCRIFAVW
jgi:hypothetical protein